MYSSKSYNNKSSSAFVSSKDDRFVFVMAAEPWSQPAAAIPGRWKGKKPTVTRSFHPSGQFSEPEYKMSDGGDIIKATRYSQTQPAERRKLGFGSHDAPRRDEFLNFVRSSQFSEQTRSEARCFVKHRSKLAAIGTSVISPTKGVDDSGPTSTGGAGAGVSAPSPMNAAAKPSLSEMLSATLASMTRTRVFASPSVFDRVRDQRSPRTVYGIRRRSSPSGHLDLGGWSRSSGVVGDGVSEAKLCTPQARKVSAVRDFYRANGGEF